MVLRWLVLAAGVALAGSAYADDQALFNVGRRLARHQTLRIVAFGSSSTQGVGASSPTAAYPSDLERDLSATGGFGSVQVLNRGVGGQDADDMMARIEQDALAPRPDLVIWQTGSNDPLRGVPIDRFKRETSAAVLKLKSAGVDVMLLEPQFCKVFDETPGSDIYTQAVRDIGAALGVPVIKRHNLMKVWLSDKVVTYDQLVSRDGLHMTDDGYALLAREIARQIMRAARFGASAGVVRLSPAETDDKAAPAS